MSLVVRRAQIAQVLHLTLSLDLMEVLSSWSTAEDVCALGV